MQRYIFFLFIVVKTGNSAKSLLFSCYFVIHISFYCLFVYSFIFLFELWSSVIARHSEAIHVCLMYSSYYFYYCLFWQFSLVRIANPHQPNIVQFFFYCWLIFVNYNYLIIIIFAVAKIIYKTFREHAPCLTPNCFLIIYIVSIMSIIKHNCINECITNCFVVIILFFFKFNKYDMLNMEVNTKTR